MSAGFDEVQLPLRVGFGASCGPQFSTEVVVIDGGYERRNQNWAQARRRYDARTGVRNGNDAVLISAFFHARAGKARGFRLKDPTDYSSAVDNVATPKWNDQIIGTGDGTAVSFQLIKNYGSGGITHQRQIRKPVSGSVSVGVNGTQASSGWGVGATNGVVTFDIAPLNGQVITAGFQFDVPVRFDVDQLQLVAEDGKLFQAAIPLIEIRV